MTNKLVFATGNPGKLREAREILGAAFEVLSPADAGVSGEAEETGSTFKENSLLKAQYLFDRCGLACFADDSGLEVDDLGGAPGIYSARYASDHNFADNIDRVLTELKQLESEGTATPGNRLASLDPTADAVPPLTLPRVAWVSGGSVPSELGTFPGKARFRCVATLILPGREPVFFDGAVEGRIARKRCGAGGFGYDPVFVADAYPDRTIAELPEDVKNGISHRGVALRKMAAWLAEQF